MTNEMTYPTFSLLRTLVASILLGAVAALFLWIVNFETVRSEIAQILMLISGMSVFIAGTLFISAFSKDHTRSNKPWKNVATPVFNIDFEKHHSAINEVIDAEFSEVDNISTSGPSIEKLIQLEDPVLIMAKVRLDADRALRKYAAERKVQHNNPRIGLGGLMETLSDGYLPDQVSSAINELLVSSNQALHGNETSLETALDVAVLWQDIFSYLRNVKNTSN